MAVDGANGWTSSQIDGLLASGDFGYGASLGIDTGNTTFTYGNLTDTAAGQLGLVVLGNGALLLTGSDTYSGGTEVVAGILNIQNDLALGDATNGVVVDGGATLQMQGGIAVATTGTLTLKGDGAGGIGVLNSLSGDNYWSGPICIGDDSLGDTRIESDAGVCLSHVGSTASIPASR